MAEETKEVAEETQKEDAEESKMEPVVIKISQEFKNMPVNIPGWMNL